MSSSMNGEGEAPRSSWQRPDAPLGTLIFREGLLSAEQLEDALGESVKRGKRLGQVLVERGLLEEAQVARILARQKGLDYVDLAQTPVDPAAASLLSPETAWLTHAMPIAVVDGTPLVAVEDPGDEESMKAIAEALGTQPSFAVATRTDILRALGGAFPQASGDAQPADVPAPLPQIQVVPESAPAAPVPAQEAQAAPAPQPVMAEASGLRVAGPPPAQAAEPAPEAGPQPVAAEPAPVEAPSPAPVAALVEPVTAEPVSPPVAAPEPVAPAVEAAPEPVAPTAPPAAPEPAPEQPQAAQPAPEPPVFEPVPPAAPPAADPPPEAQAPPVAETPPAEPPPVVPPEQPPAPAEPPTAPEPPAETPSEAPVVVEFPPPAPVPDEPPAAPEPQPVPEPEPPPLEVVPPAPEPEPEPQHDPSPPPETPAALHVAEPGSEAQAREYRVVARLTDGAEIEVDTFASLEEARGAAKLLSRQIGAAAPGEWPHLGGRYVRPDLIVSVDLL